MQQAKLWSFGGANGTRILGLWSWLVVFQSFGAYYL